MNTKKTVNKANQWQGLEKKDDFIIDNTIHLPTI